MGFPTEGAGGSRGPVRVTVETQDGETRDVTCRLLVAADGGDSKASGGTIGRVTPVYLLLYLLFWLG